MDYCVLPLIKTSCSIVYESESMAQFEICLKLYNTIASKAMLFMLFNI